MKKMLLLLLAVCLLASVFAGCSAEANMHEPYTQGYSNVSTTNNGTVNGTNHQRTPASGYYAGTYGSGSYASGSGTSGRTTRTGTVARTNTAASTRTYPGTASGTGMRGGR